MSAPRSYPRDDWEARVLSPQEFLGCGGIRSSSLNSITKKRAACVVPEKPRTRTRRPAPNQKPETYEI